AVVQTLRELGAQDMPQVRIFNKADAIDVRHRRELEHGYPGWLFISAATGEGVERALTALQDRLSARWLLRELELPHALARIHGGAIRDASQVLSQTDTRSTTRLRLRVTAENWDRLRKKLAGTRQNPWQKGEGVC
ncbi:MAG: hypothetical protein PHF00_11220, partial [Elusimicrobia bacterium]|nr:hypothetical protein [Elusimicrobiota bacterium]